MIIETENLLLDSHGNLKVSDFGLSALQQQGVELLHTTCGTPNYVAPEMNGLILNSFKHTKKDRIIPFLCSFRICQGVINLGYSSRLYSVLSEDETKLRDYFDQSHLQNLNEKVYQFQGSGPNVRVSRDSVLGQLLRSPMARVGWLQPPIDFIKMNTDASFVDKTNSGGGVVFRDELGELRGLFLTRFKNVDNEDEAELEALSFGLFLALRLRFLKLVVEMDSLVVVQALTSREIRLELLNKFMNLPFSELEDYQMSHVLRECNNVAHTLADWGRSVGTRTYPEMELVYKAIMKGLLRAIWDDYNRMLFYRFRQHQLAPIPCGNLPREDTSSHYHIFVGDLSPEVTDAMLFKFFSHYPSCSGARVMWDRKNGRSRGYGFVSFSIQQEAQCAIKDLTGKWLGSKAISCNWALKGAGVSK
ncbi:hypothetical protein Vadar_021353 [Vaccinium darrowii]|uniref:Uncharacterized protein n=1 Tax=Vaccinium darrowii TaxID=229202 RepID=A0ACB7XJ06_9ERIC|nr:hypothetical protein Vadar_021353 [Vaccinium darrowii]